MSQLSIRLTRQDLRSHRTRRFRVFVFFEELSGFCHLSVLRVSSLIAPARNHAFPGLARTNGNALTSTLQMCRP
ncbi:hypothetical protein BV25DRAFT_1828558, partial [Artomyces pyxidatus]